MFCINSINDECMMYNMGHVSNILLGPHELRLTENVRNKVSALLYTERETSLLERGSIWEPQLLKHK